MTVPPGNGSQPTIREVYQLVQALETKLMAELDKLSVEWAAKLEAHRVEHDRDRDRRSSLVRWAVTSVLSGVGLLIAFGGLYVTTRT